MRNLTKIRLGLNWVFIIAILVFVLSLTGWAKFHGLGPLIVAVVAIVLRRVSFFYVAHFHNSFDVDDATDIDYFIDDLTSEFGVQFKDKDLSMVQTMGDLEQLMLGGSDLIIEHDDVWSRLVEVACNNFGKPKRVDRDTSFFV